MPYPTEPDSAIVTWLHVLTAIALGFIVLMASTDCRPLVPVVEFIVGLKS